MVGFGLGSQLTEEMGIGDIARNAVRRSRMGYVAMINTDQGLRDQQAEQQQRATHQRPVQYCGLLRILCAHTHKIIADLGRASCVSP